MKLYKVTKKDGRTKDSDLTTFLCGQPCAASVLNDEALAKLAGDKIHLMEGDLWESQDELNPKIGSPILFTATKMDAGWLRTSPVKGFTIKDNGDVEIETLNSIYYATLED